ncbi:MAG: hypothetical protein WBG92_24780 [Thiohalocapsa sp.]
MAQQDALPLCLHALLVILLHALLVILKKLGVYFVDSRAAGRLAKPRPQCLRMIADRRALVRIDSSQMRPHQRRAWM